MTRSTNAGIIGQRPAILSATLGLMALTGCANPAKDQYFIPLDAIEPSAGSFTSGEAIPADEYPVAVRSAVVTGDLLVGGEVALELAAAVEAEDAAVVAGDAAASIEPSAGGSGASASAPNAERAAAFARLTESQRDVLAVDAGRALLLEAWMESRIEPVAMSRTDVLRAQQQLARLGFDPGPQDGIPGRRTAAAVEQFQSARGLPVTGQITPALLDLMAREAS